MEGPHAGSFPFAIVVVTEEVEDAVDDEEGYFAFWGVTGLVCLAEGLGEAEDNVAQVWGLVGGGGEDGVGFARGGLGIVVTLPRAGVGGGEGEDVCDFIVAAVAGVEVADCGVVAEGEGQLAWVVGEGGIEGGEGSPSEEVFGQGGGETFLDGDVDLAVGHGLAGRDISTGRVNGEEWIKARFDSGGARKRVMAPIVVEPKGRGCWRRSCFGNEVLGCAALRMR